jgi:ABC-type branched-subunit amino acid transport system ATPase component/ABC-type branched-subunit amino acid transport system permease subunit
MLSAIESGIVIGALYAIAGLGLVTVYMTTRVMNFALGGMGAVASFVAYNLLGRGLPYWAAFVIAVAVGALLGAIVEVGVARPLQRVSPITVALGTLGALLILQGAMGAWYGYNTYSLREALAGVRALSVGSFGISANQILILAIAIVATLLVVGLFRRTRLGLAMRATSSGPQTSELLGVNVSRVRLASWAIGGALGALAALLVTPLIYLSPSSFTSVLLTAFAAVILGGFTSIGGVVVGAILFSVAINIVELYLPASLTSTYTFIGVTLVLVFRPHGLFGRHEHQVPEPQTATRRAPMALAVTAGNRRHAPGEEHPGGWRTRFGAKPVGWLVVLAVFLILPSVLSGPNLYTIAAMLATFIAVLGLNVISGYAGQISLGTAGFLTIGAYTAAVVSVHAGIPILGALVIAVVVGAVVGLVIGLPATRLSGIYLALATLAFGFAVPEFVQWLGKFTGGANGLPLAVPAWLSGTTAQYWFVLALAGVVAALILAAGATRLGRGWRAVRDSETGARALGLNPTVIKLGAFALSSALAALGGALTGMLSGFVSPQSFGVFTSIYLLLAVVLGGSGSVFGSLLGAVFITVLPTYLPTSVPPDIVFGAAMVAILIIAPGGLVGVLTGLGTRAREFTAQWWGARTAPVAVLAAETGGPAAAGSGTILSPVSVPSSAALTEAPDLTGSAAAERVPEDGLLLELRAVSAGYGLVKVLHQVSLQVRRGEIVTVIGANGAGKSTLLRAISHVVPLTAGTMLWRGQELGRSRNASPHAVTRLGISHVPEGRAIFPDLTVEENLAMGSFGLGSRGEGKRTHSGKIHATAADQGEIFELFPRLRERLRQRAGTLSGGEQQMLAIARALLARPDLLLLDEPSLGLAPVVVQRVFDAVRTIAASGVSILLVEQNADAALALADRGYMISGGRIAFSGTGEQLRTDERVVQTYLAR